MGENFGQEQAMHIIFRGLAAFALGIVTIAAAWSQDAFPSRPITMVVPFPAGGGTDIAARLLARRMSVLLDQQVIVMNRAGAGGNIGAASVARSAPDGYTLLMGTQGTHGSNASLYRNLGYDTIKDFTPVSMVATTPLMLLSSPQQHIGTVRELIAAAKAKPGALNYGSSSIGGSPHLAMEMLKMMTGIQMVHIPYQGSAPLRTALLSGEIAVMFDNIPSALPLALDGRAVALGVSGATRAAAAPQVPTVAESGVPGFEVSAWYGVLAPAHLPPSIVAKLNNAIGESLRSKEVADKLVEQGYQPSASKPEEFAAQIKTDLKTYAELVSAAGIEKQ